MRKKRTVMIRLFSLLLALVLLSIPASAIAQESGQTTTDIKQVILLENGNKIVITTIKTLPSARSNTVTIGEEAQYLNSKDEVLCSFTLYGIFDKSTKRCIDASHVNYTSGGTWRVEDAKTWHDSYKAYGSAKFVQRVLGIKVGTEPVSIELSY